MLVRTRDNDSLADVTYGIEQQPWSNKELDILKIKLRMPETMYFERYYNHS